MPRVPEGLKRRLLPAWNGGHRAAWRAGEYLGAVRHGRFGRCAACGRFGPWLYRRWVVPPKLEELWGLSPALAEALARKESSDCAWCGAKLRARRLAEVVLGLFPGGPRSLTDWVARPEVAGLRVAEINRIDGVHETLRRLPGFAPSDFREGVEPGTVIDGVRCEDLARLTYADDSFDLVLTSETLEHVPDLGRALREVLRVLKPGGWHVFTVPLLPGVPTTFARSAIAPGGSVLHLTTPIRHPGGDTGYPVFTEFGADFPEALRGAGFVSVRMEFGPPSESDLAQVFVARKMGGA